MEENVDINFSKDPRILKYISYPHFAKVFTRYDDFSKPK